MESDKPTVEELIAAVLIDIEQKGFSAIQPFSIGDVELRMKYYAQNNGIALACEQLYMSAKQLQHYECQTVTALHACLKRCKRSGCFCRRTCAFPKKPI